jgi:hypothetical protein
MQGSQTQTGDPSLRAERTDLVSTLSKFLGLFSGLWQSWPRGEDRTAARYDGRAWCDSTEHQLTNEIMSGTRNRW